VAFLPSIFGGRSLDAILRKARACLAEGDFEDGLALVEAGLERFPDASVLRDTGHLLRRAQARSGIRGLKDRVDQDSEPHAHAQLIALYRDVGMEAEMIVATERFAKAHPGLDQPHLLRGEQLLEVFFADLRACDGGRAIEHLITAATLQPDALKPRLMLAEIYYAIGADKALLGQSAAIRRLAGDDDVFAPILAAIAEAGRPVAAESVDALLAKVEVTGALVRDPSTWSGRKRRGIGSESEAARLQQALFKLVAGDGVEEAVAIDRAGSLLAHAPGAPAQGRASDAADADAHDDDAEATALAGVARAVARTIKAQARELELGAFRRCVVEGPFGVMVVADAAGGVVAARAGRGVDPHRLTDRLCVAVDGVRRRTAS